MPLLKINKEQQQSQYLEEKLLQRYKTRKDAKKLIKNIAKKINSNNFTGSNREKFSMLPQYWKFFVFLGHQ